MLRGDAFMIKAAACGRDIRLTAPVQSDHQPAAAKPLQTTTAANKLLTDPRAEAVLLAVRGTNPPKTKPQA